MTAARRRARTREPSQQPQKLALLVGQMPHTRTRSPPTRTSSQNEPEQEWRYGPAEYFPRLEPTSKVTLPYLTGLPFVGGDLPYFGLVCLTQQVAVRWVHGLVLSCSPNVCIAQSALLLRGCTGTTGTVTGTVTSTITLDTAHDRHYDRANGCDRNQRPWKAKRRAGAWARFLLWYGQKKIVPDGQGECDGDSGTEYR